MNNDRYEIEVSANISSFKKSMKELQLEIAEKKRMLADLQKENKYNTVGSKAFTTYSSEIIDLKEEIGDAENSLKEMTSGSEEAGTSMAGMFKNATKNGKKFLLSLFSIRTIWSLVSKGANTYIQENEQLNQSIQLTASLLGNTLAPIIKVVVNVAQYAMIIVSELIRVFTGYDAIAGTVTNANKNIASSAKQANKQLAGFDTINNLSSGTDSTSSSITSMTDALGDFQEKVEKIRDIFNEYETPIKLATVALGGMVGASMLSKITNLIGTAGTAAGAGAVGLTGILSTLGYIAAIGVIAVEIYYNVKVWKEIIEDGQEISQTYEDLGDNATTLKDKQNELNNSFQSLYNQGELNSEKINFYIEQQRSSISTTQLETERIIEQKNSLAGLFMSTKQTTESIKELSDKQYESTLALAENSIMIGENGEERQATIQTVKDSIEQLKKNRSELVNDKDAYKECTTQIEALETKLGELDSSYDAEVNIETDKAKSKLEELWTGFKKLSALSPSGASIGTKIANWVGDKLFSYDVGTNYVPNDQVAQIHKGEMIVPAKYNPSTSGISGSYEVVNKLNTLINVLENKEFNAYLDGNKITDRVITGINAKSRLAGGSVIK